MTQVSMQTLENKLQGVASIRGIQKVLSEEGLALSEAQIAQGLIAEGVSPRFAGLSPSAQEQVAQVVVLAERNQAVAHVLTSPDQVTAQLPALLAAEGISLDAEALSALSAPLELDDEQLEQVVGGSTAALVIGLIGTVVVPTLATIFTLWINKHYDTKVKIAEIDAK